MICIDVLNEYIRDLRGLSTIKSHFIIVKGKEKALAIGPLKKFSVQVWFLKSKTEKVNVMNISTLSPTLNVDSENRVWELLEKKLTYLIYQMIGKEELYPFIEGSYLGETREINIT